MPDAQSSVSAADRRLPRPSYWAEIAAFVAADRAVPISTRRPPLEERFWSRVERTDGCWLWRGHINQDGYGRLPVGEPTRSRMVMAHRLALFLEGREVPPGMVTRHKCNNPSCVRPDHLEIGTQAENVGDTVAAGRVPRGEQAHNAVLTAEDVAEIRRSTETHREIAERFGIAAGSVHAIRTGRRWGHVDEKASGHPRRQGEKAFSADDIRDIRSSSEPSSVLAKRYGSSPAAVTLARRGLTYFKYNDAFTPQIHVTSTRRRNDGAWVPATKAPAVRQ